LQRIGICYFFAALAVLHMGVRGQAILFAGLLGGYWALLRYVAVPGFSAFDLTKEGNLAAYVDRLVVPGKLYYGFGDNEGLLSTLPAIATTLLGALAGHWLMSGRSPLAKCLGLFIGAAACLAAGYAWSEYFPVIKILWTSSYVLIAGGYSLALLGLFYLVIDVLGWRRWAFFFTVIGMNPITIYVMAKFVDFKKMGEFFVGGLANYTSPEIYPLILVVTVLAIKWLVLLYLYRNKTFLRV
jgi:predicted acyltransferase